MWTFNDDDNADDNNDSDVNVDNNIVNGLNRGVKTKGGRILSFRRRCRDVSMCTTYNESESQQVVRKCSGVARIFTEVRTILQIALPPPPHPKENKQQQQPSLIKDLVTL